MTIVRTKVQRDADKADCDLFRVIAKVESIYDSVKHHNGQRVTDLHKSLMELRHARSGIRMMMHESDRARTS